MLMTALLAMSGAGAMDEGEPIYGGCTDARGAAVPALSDPTLPAAVASRVEAGRAVIRHNPAVLPRLLPASRHFLFAQTCARLALGHEAGVALDAAQARRADCLAIDSLRRAGLLEGISLPALAADLRLSDEEWAAVPGPRRDLDFATCGGSTGGLLLPAAAGAGQAAWNACVQACAAPLYRCQARCAAGDCADCEAGYERCVAACGAP